MTDLAHALRLCGYLDGETFSVGAIRDRQGRFECFSDVAAAEDWLSQYPDHNRYFCPNPVKPGTTGRPKADDVTVARVLLMDADPAPDEAAARSACLKLAGYLNDRVLQYPNLCDSGRGTQAWVKVALGNGARRRLARGLAGRCALTGAKWDGTHDPARLMRLPGTVNLKTGREASIIHEGTGPVITEEMLGRLDLPPDEPEQAAVAIALGPPTPGDMALVVGRAKDVWDDAGDTDRSKRDFRLVLELLRLEAPPESACRLLYAMPGSKAATDGRGEDYWRSTLDSARRHLAQEQRLRAEAEELPEVAKDDPGAPFEPAALDALLLYRELGEADWQRLRAELKKSKVAIRALEDAMAARQRSRADHVAVEIRYVAADCKRVGWFRRTQTEDWVPVDASEAKSIMRSSGLDPDEEIEAHTREPWTLVNEPFQKEELDGRRWNKDGARYAVLPAEGPCPTWDGLLAHVGRSLDPVVLEDPWCVANGVRAGGDYLLVWIAAVLQRPKARTAYLFLHGEQESGKSTFHEALRPLLTRGYVRANHALKSKEGFNGEIANAVICVVEEVDLSDPRRETHERVKDWVTGDTISVRAMYRQAYDLPNYTHWIQAAQKRSFMPVLPNDTRITEIDVERPDSPMPKDEMMGRLLAEGPQFLHRVTSLKLPEPTGRLLVPALQTEGKTAVSAAAGTDLEAWLQSADWYELDDYKLVNSFLDQLPGGQKGNWDRQRVLREIPAQARRDQRLARALKALDFGPSISTQLYKAMPAVVQADCRHSVVKFGHAMGRVRTHLPWLEQVTIRGSATWRRVGVAAPSP